MKRWSGLFVPVLLAVVGVALIVAGDFTSGEGPSSSLEPFATPTLVAVATGTPAPTGTPGVSAVPTPTPTPPPADWVAVQLQVASVDVNVKVIAQTDPRAALPQCCAVLLANASQPGRNGNTYIAAHAQPWLFKGLWNVLLGAQVQILMSDGQVLPYRITEIHPNVACPDPHAEPMPDPPLDLVYGEQNCHEGFIWTQQTGHERLTLQTSQGYNRNWGELVVIALPEGW